MKKLLFAAMLFAAVHMNAQTKTSGKDETPFIEVTGSAQKEITPDIIYIGISLSDKITTKGADYTIADQENRLKKLVKDLNIDVSNLVLADASSNIIQRKQKEKGVIQRKEYVLKLSTAAQVGQVFEALYNNDIKEAMVTEVDHSKIAEYRKEVRINAIKAAKEKAVYLLEAIGEELGKALEINEQDGMETKENMQTRSANVNYYSIGGTGGNDTEFKKITLYFSYYVKYAIK